MLYKTLGVSLIVVLGAAWFALQELGAPVLSAPAAAGPQVAEALPAVEASQPPVTQRRAQPARRPSPAQDAPVPLQAEASPRREAASGRTEPAPAAAASSYTAAMMAAARRQAEGDRAGAEAALREALQQATTRAEGARAALHLALLSSNLLERRQLVSAALSEGVVVGDEYEVVRDLLREINRSPGSSLHPLLELDHYEVQPNDSLWKLCNKVFPERYGVTPEVGLVKLVNGLSSDNLRVGQTLAVPRQDLHLVVDARENGLSAWLGQNVVAAYRVGLGREERTPRGDFTITVKQKDPPWYRDGKVVPFGDPENVLGTRWLGFDNQPGASGFGIHGTTDPSSIGKNESMGCVRLRNEEVEELFEIVPRGTRVTIL